MVLCQILQSLHCVWNIEKLCIGEVAYNLFAHNKSFDSPLVKVGDIAMTVANFCFDGKKKCCFWIAKTTAVCQEPVDAIFLCIFCFCTDEGCYFVCAIHLWESFMWLCANGFVHLRFSNVFIVFEVLLHFYIHAVLNQSLPNIIYGNRSRMNHVVGIKTIIA